MMKRMIINKVLIFSFCTLASISLYSQNTPCGLTKNADGIFEVNKDGVICLSKNTSKPTLIYTFATWCQPCILHLDDVLKIAKEYKVELHILLVEKKETKYADMAIKYLDRKQKGLSVLTTKDIYGKRIGKQYKNFLTAITPGKFRNINGMSKYILLDNKGEVLMVTSWKDRLKNESWEDDMPMLQRKIIPFLYKNN